MSTLEQLNRTIPTACHRRGSVCRRGFSHPRLQIPADQADDDALDGEFAGRIDEQGGDAGVVTAEDYDPMGLMPFDAETFQGRFSIDQAGADPPLDVFGLDSGAVVDEHDVAGFEGRLHAVKRKPQAEVIRRRFGLAVFDGGIDGGPAGIVPKRGNSRVSSGCGASCSAPPPMSTPCGRSRATARASIVLRRGLANPRSIADRYPWFMLAAPARATWDNPSSFRRRFIRAPTVSRALCATMDSLVPTL